MLQTTFSSWLSSAKIFPGELLLFLMEVDSQIYGQRLTEVSANIYLELAIMIDS